MGMKQPGTDRGIRHETGEHLPAGAKSSDGGGERSVGTKNGVGMGSADHKGSQEGATGRSGMGGSERGEFNTGRSEGDCYSHKRLRHSQG